MENLYNDMTKDELIAECENKDAAIREYIKELQKKSCVNYSKSDIMDVFKCESNKALKILRLLFQMNYGIKIGKEYYVQPSRLEDFMQNFAGKEVFI